MQSVVIVGGGISGLSAAYFLEKCATEAGLDISIRLLESRPRLGGVIVTERSGGFVAEGGPDAFFTQKPAAIELCRALGLADRLIPSNDRRRKTYVLQQGKLQELPEGMFFLVPTKVLPVFRSKLLSVPGKLRLMLEPFQSRLRREEDFSVSDFVSHRLGRQVLERIAEPLLSAVYGANVDSLSARAVLPQLLALEDKHGSLWRGIRHARHAQAQRQTAGSPGSLFMSLRNGIGDIIQSLEANLAKTQVTLRRKVDKVLRGNPSSAFRLLCPDGERQAAALILATPAHAAGKMLQEMDGRLAGKLEEIPYHSSVTVSLGFDERKFGRTLDGFGFIVPRGEGKKLIACTWVSTKFSFRCPPGRVLLRGFLGGARDASATAESDDRIIEMTLRELRETMGVQAEPLFTRIHRWEKSMPQYSVGHPRRLEEIGTLVSKHPGLFLSGNGYRGIGMPDCIASSSTVAEAAVNYLQSLQ